jgi:predicted O-linked N-acetylglucosamine transferase (SPINDLY family)/glycosyltransferase involved in cell wall biosynthesis
MRIAFADPLDWNYRIETAYQKPLGGSQSALCYLAEALAQQGHDVFLLNHAALSGISRGVICLPLNLFSVQLLKSLQLDCVIVLNVADLGRQIKPHLDADTPLVLWTQHAADQPEMQLLQQPEGASLFTAIAFVSEWQRQQCQQVFDLRSIKTAVLRNAIAPCFAHLFPGNTSILSQRSHSLTLAYTSTPFRGLELLLEAFPMIRQAIPQVRLQIFSSMQVYQTPAVEDQFHSLYQRCRQMAEVEYLGSKPQPELAQALRSVTVFAYPNLFLETSCIAVLEAMACGCLVVTSQLAALPETTAGLARLVPIPKESVGSRYVQFSPEQRQTYLRHFTAAVIEALQLVQSGDLNLENSLRQQVDYANRCLWSVRAQAWVKWLSQMQQPQEERLRAIGLEQNRAEQNRVIPAEPAIAARLAAAAQEGQAGHFAAAERMCQQIVQHHPEQATAWNLLGLAVFHQGRAQEALGYIERAIALHPSPEFYNHLGVIHFGLGQIEAGLAAYRQSLQLQPSADAHYNLGLGLHRQQHVSAAIEHYRQAIALHPNHLPALQSLGQALQQQHQSDAAIAIFRQALAAHPQQAEIWHQLGSVYQGQGELNEAAHCYQQALTYNPQYVEAHNNLGAVLQEQEQVDQTIAHYQQALALRPNFANALLNLGNLFLKLERFSEAAAAYRQLLTQQPENVRALDGLVRILRQTCDWTDLQLYSDRLLSIARQRIAQDSPTEIMPLNTLLLPFSAAEQQAIAQDYAQEVTQSMASRRQELNFETGFADRRVPGRFSRIRLGYVSGDFRDHAVAHLMLQLFGLHDRQQFEVFAYSFGPDDGSAYRHKLQRDCDRFLDCANTSPTACAQHVVADQIDILIDLAGYTSFSCPHLFALRPAPIQVNYLGYPGTLGAEFIDYIITDPIVTPAHLAPFLSETCAYLPHCYQINDNQQHLGHPHDSSPLVGASSPPLIYCCFNNTRKIEPQMFAVWLRILQQVPHSVLWLFQSVPEAEHNLKQEAECQGIRSDRLWFAQHIPKPQHLQRLQQADLFLDTQFYNAHTTASDALWAGVPVITLPGDTFASRVATSLLTAIGLPELSVANLTAYERLAVHLAHHPDELRDLKNRLKANRSTLPLFDTERSVRYLEQSYQQMWQRWQSKQPPQPIWISSLFGHCTAAQTITQ